MKNNISFVNLGCAKNQVDLEHLMAKISSNGFNIVSDYSSCDAIIINTCGFITPAVQESIDTILEMREAIPEKAKLIVTGCLSERYKQSLEEEMDEIDLAIGLNEEERLINYLKEKLNFEDSSKGEGIVHNRILFSSAYSAYLKISEGCNASCAFCIIPQIRGGLKSRSIEDILSEAKDLAESGIKEIVIISQDTTQYGLDLYGEKKIVELLDKLSNLLPQTLFRLLYLNPEGVSNELVALIAERENIIKYFEVPVQHISQDVLSRMRRRAGSKQIYNAFDTIRNKIPDAFIRTTFIVGFPGETEEDFMKLKDFIIKYKPDYAGFFPYYNEEGSYAYSHIENNENRISDKVKKARIKELQKLQKENTISRLKALGKSEFLCFIDKVSDEFEYLLEGRAIFQAPDTDGKLFISSDKQIDNNGPFKAIIDKISYPDIYGRII